MATIIHKCLECERKDRYIEELKKALKVGVERLNGGYFATTFSKRNALTVMESVLNKIHD